MQFPTVCQLQWGEVAKLRETHNIWNYLFYPSYTNTTFSTFDHISSILFYPDERFQNTESRSQPFFAICVPRCCPLGNDMFEWLKSIVWHTQRASKAVRPSKWPVFAKLRATFIQNFRNRSKTIQFPCFLLSRPDTTDMWFLLQTHISLSKKHSLNEFFALNQSPLILKTRHQVCETARNWYPTHMYLIWGGFMYVQLLC